MKLSDSYWSAMDRKDSPLTSISNIGIGTHAGKDQLQELKAKIFKGAGAVELGFMGRGKGVKGQGNTTPGMHGKEEREAMRDLAKINKVRLSTHATVAAGSWSGFHDRQFDENQREQNIIEGKRAIEFAADVAEGGPVVIHTGEFPRSISKTPEAEKFVGFPAEEKEMGERVHYLMDKKTGQLIIGIREDQINHIPAYVKGSGQQEVEWADKPGGKLKVIDRDWKYYKDKAEQNKRDYGHIDPNSADYDPEKSDNPEVLFYSDKLQAQKLHAAGQADEYELMYHKYGSELRDLPTVEEAKREIQKIAADRNIPDQIKIKKMEEMKEIIDKRDDIAQKLRKQMNYGREVAAGARAQEAEIEDQQKRVVTLDQYGVEKTADSIARLAMFALKEQEDKELKRDLFIAPENIFPEMGYGSHPEELKEIVTKSREDMAKILRKEKPGMSQSQADEIAARHIKATFDIGHANTWKKYFKGKDKDFKKWLIDQVSKLNKSGVLGHVHITDNFGYYDEHLSPGQGNVPVEDFVKELKKSGYKGQITVETAEQDYKAMTEMWRMVNSPVYKIAGASHSWTDVEYGYFGRTASPNYLFGPTAPDPKTWTLWSEIPLE